jgi:hypothetical protein
MYTVNGVFVLGVKVNVPAAAAVSVCVVGVQRSPWADHVKFTGSRPVPLLVVVAIIL